MTKSPWLKDGDREKARAEKRGAILDAAIKLFGNRGYHATSFADIAEYLGVTKPTVYHYFKNKEELLFACFDVGTKKIELCLDPDLDDEASGYERLRAFLFRYALSASDPYVSCIAKVSSSDFSDENQNRFQQIRRGIDAILRKLIQSGIEDGSIVANDVRISAFAAAGAINTIPVWYSDEGPRDAEHVAKVLVDFLMRSFRPESGVSASAAATPPAPCPGTKGDAQ